MLRQRVITALVLVSIMLAALSANSAWPFAVLTLLMIAAAGWEWGRLNQSGGPLALAMGVALALAGAWALSAGWTSQAPALIWWLTLALWAAWLSVAQARSVGINFLLSVLCLVWMADVAAYFGGRAFGRRKLAPSISPGKSWEGVWSGMLGVLALAAFWIWLDTRGGFDGPSVYTRLWQSLGGLGMLVALLGLCGLSVVGDLVESLVKRAAGAKDSSRLLPGHGGVLDRVDALLPVVPAALALMTLNLR